MSYRLIKVNTSKVDEETILKIAEHYPVEQFWQVEGKHGMSCYNFLVDTDLSQKLLDAISSVIGHDLEAKVIVTNVEAVLPKREKEIDEEREHQKKKLSRGLSREELYEDVKSGADLNYNYFLLILFSTIVAGVGLLQNSPAVVIGAMVIAPLLGPNLAFALSTAIADFELSRKAIITNLAGLSFAVSISTVMGIILNVDINNAEIMSRTEVNMEAIFLALASGGAGVLSLTAGVSSVLVGVMVAVALLPPTVVFGLMLGSANYQLAIGAILLLFVNVVCINLSANLVFLFKGIAPKTWYKKQKARKKMIAYMSFWLIMLITLTILIYFKNEYLIN